MEHGYLVIAAPPDGKVALENLIHLVLTDNAKSLDTPDITCEIDYLRWVFDETYPEEKINLLDLPLYPAIIFRWDGDKAQTIKHAIMTLTNLISRVTR